MSLRSLEAAILVEAKQVVGNSKLRQKDIMEWSTGNIEPQEGEKVYELPGIGVNIAIKEEPNETTST